MQTNIDACGGPWMKNNFLHNLAAKCTADTTPQAAQSPPWIERIKRRANKSIHDFGVTLARTHGGAFYQNTPDRLVLENIILPLYQLSKEHRNILFVGCDWYTAGYARLFALKTYATMDPDAHRAQHGAHRHQIAPMRLMGSVHPEGSLDLVVCNGVFGWGLNEIAEAETSVGAAFNALRPGGHMIIGWNDLTRHRPFAPSDIASLQKFEPYVFPPLDAHQHRIDHELRHTFNFYVKPL